MLRAVNSKLVQTIGYAITIVGYCVNRLWQQGTIQLMVGVFTAILIVVMLFRYLYSDVRG